VARAFKEHILLKNQKGNIQRKQIFLIKLSLKKYFSVYPVNEDIETLFFESYPSGAIYCI